MASLGVAGALRRKIIGIPSSHRSGGVCLGFASTFNRTSEGGQTEATYFLGGPQNGHVVPCGILLHGDCASQLAGGGSDCPNPRAVAHYGPTFPEKGGC